MARPRSQLISYSDTPYYHIISRCVRRAFLCGQDPYTKKDYEHRRQWIVDRLRILSSVFSIEVCAYAIMSNHIHLVLKAVPDEVKHWSDREVIRRWLSIFKGPDATQKYINAELLKPADKDILEALIPVWRSRLTEISWFMKCLNEPIARQANKEDHCTGHFWEARFKSHALLDEEALLTAMVYVDLNPVRAGITKTPESSNFTSVKERIKPQFNLADSIKTYCEHGGFDDHLLSENNPIPIRALTQFTGGETQNNTTIGIHFYLKDYLELVDYSGRAIREDKTGHIAASLPPILERLAITHKSGFVNCQNFEAIYYKRFAPKLFSSG